MLRVQLCTVPTYFTSYLLCITVAVQLASSSSESVNPINSTTAKSAIDVSSEPVSEALQQPLTCNRLSDSGGVQAPRPASVGDSAAKLSAKTACGGSDPRDIVARIYREELQKLAATAKTNGNFAEYIMYERELERLAHSSMLAPEPLPPVTSPTPHRRRKDSRHSASSKRSVPTVINRNTTPQTVPWPVVETPIVDHPEDLTTKSVQPRVDKSDTESTSISDVASHSVHSTPDLNCARTDSASSTDMISLTTAMSVSQQDVEEGALAVKLEEPSAEVDADAQQFALKVDGDCSPLDLMRTIADSVTSKSQKKSLPAETPRYTLPPISADQLKRCSYLNTDEVVTAVRSTLADYSISQRLFGEAVLGLSQASSLLC